MNLQKIIEIEKKYDACNLTWNGRYYWMYSRFVIFQEYVINKSLGINQTIYATRKKSLSILGEVARYIKYSLKNRKIKPVDIVFATHSRRVKCDGKYRCIYTDRLAERYEKSISLEQPYQSGHLEPIYTSNVFYTDLAVIRSELFFYINKIFRRSAVSELRKEISEKIIPMLKEMEQEFNITIELNRVTNEVIRNYYVEDSRRRYYLRLLKSFNPQKVVEVVHYSVAMMALTEAAHMLDIPVIELQHGTMSSAHTGYQYNTEVTARCLPDYIFTFSDFWGEQINLPAQVKPIAVGYDYFEQQVAAGGVIEHTKKTIIFISQETIGKKLSKLACELADKLNPEEYRIIYKLHPAEAQRWKKEYSWLVDSWVEVADGSGKSLYEYFKESDIQVGVHSTAVYEGLGFNLRTAIYNVEYAETMKPLIDRELAVYIDDVEELIDYIEKDNTAVDSDIIWKHNAMENMIAELDKI